MFTPPRRPVGALFVLLVLVASTACSDPAAGTDDHDASGRDASSSELCIADAECDDGVFCNGAERCVAGACSPGTPPECDDGDACTSDVCDSARDRCVHTPLDADGDGAISAACGGNDCDDDDPRRYPGNQERCDPDDLDEDCDPTTFGFRDADGDGWPDAACCNVGPDGSRSCGQDCDDSFPGAHPAEAETCDGVDNDCDGAIDEHVQQTYYVDTDRDGHGDPDQPTVSACFAPDGYAERGDDCDDGRGWVHPRALEVCDVETIDEDCDGIANPDELCSCSHPSSRACPLPGVCAAGTQDCSAGGAWGACSISGTPESCNGLDDDCDGLTDEGLTVRCFPDDDNDSYPAVGASVALLCPDPARAFVGGCPAGFTDREPLGASALDCADDDAGTFPGAAETCDGVDQDCDGAVDEGRRVVCYDDGDGDGYPLAAAAPRSLCPAPLTFACPAGTTSRAPGPGTSDCDDLNAARSPAAIESCNDVDDDCDARIDEGLRIACWPDADGDSYPPSGSTATQHCPSAGQCPSATTSRDPAAGQVDCNDGSAAISPAVAEVCNGVDDNCNGMVDEGVTTTCWVDGDGDGFAVLGAASTTVCGGCPAGHTSRPPSSGSADCDDANAGVSPIVPETCNDRDDDCDGATDEGFAKPLRYRDDDQDGYGTGPAVAVCPTSAGWADQAGDCRDDDPRVHPGQTAFFDEPACPAGMEVCYQLIPPQLPDPARRAFAGCRPASGGACMRNVAYWDYDCDRRAHANQLPATCASPGDTCSGLGSCAGTFGIVLESGEEIADACGGERLLGGCACNLMIGGSTCRLSPSGSSSIAVRCN